MLNEKDDYLFAMEISIKIFDICVLEQRTVNGEEHIIGFMFPIHPTNDGKGENVNKCYCNLTKTNRH